MFISEFCLKSCLFGFVESFSFFFAAFSDVPGLGQAINGNPLQPR